MRTAYVGCTCAQRHTTTWGSTIAFLLVTAAGEREEEWSEMKTKKKRGTGTQQRKDYAGLGVCRTQSVGGFVGAIFGRSIVIPIELCIYLLSWPKGGREGVQCKDRIREKRVLKSRGRCSAKNQGRKVATDSRINGPSTGVKKRSPPRERHFGSTPHKDEDAIGVLVPA